MFRRPIKFLVWNGQFEKIHNHDDMVEIQLKCPMTASFMRSVIIYKL